MSNFKENTDYQFIFPENDPESIHISLLTGPYKDTTYKYGKVKFKEQGEEMHLLFEYYVLESSVMVPKSLEKDEQFKNYIGAFLVELMMQDNDEEGFVDEAGDFDTP